MFMPDVEDVQFNLRTVDKEINPPDPGGTGEFIRRIHYLLEDSLADLIDNSIDAEARHVHIRFFRDARKFKRITITDDGKGMDLETLKVAMKYGAQTHKGPADLGKYGAGMKTASFNQCKSMSVVTMKDGQVNARRWTLGSIKSGWECEVLDSAEAANMFNGDVLGLKVGNHGTVIVWDKLDCLQVAATELDSLTSRLLDELNAALGLRFHRFLQDGRLAVTIDVYSTETRTESMLVNVLHLDPFSYEESGSRGYPVKFKIDLTGGPDMALDAHIWPPKSEDPGYKLGGGRVAARQGFYVYRNDRLIQAGGWLGLRANDSEPHSSLARVRIDLPTSMDAIFGLNVQKSGVKAPPEFKDAVEDAQSGSTTWADYMRTADEVYRDGKKTSKYSSNVVPGDGIPARAQKRLTRLFAPEHKVHREVTFAWQTLSPDIFFEIDEDGDRILLNKAYRHKVLAGSSASGADAPLVKGLLFALVRDHFDHTRQSSKQKKSIDDLNSMIVEILKSM
jgi:hypothetical protein